MAVLNSKLLDSDLSLFSVLGLVTIPLNIGPGYEWQGRDINSNEARGAAFYAYKPQNTGWDMLPDVSFTIVDVTGDPDEPDVSSLEQENVEGLDKILRASFETQLEGTDRVLNKWMNSHLNHTEDFKALVTAYIINEQGKENQYISVRMQVRERKIIVVGTFDISKKDSLAEPVFNVIRNVSILSDDL